MLIIKKKREIYLLTNYNNNIKKNICFAINYNKSCYKIFDNVKINNWRNVSVCIKGHFHDCSLLLRNHSLEKN